MELIESIYTDMTIFFAFSDESGLYKSKPNDKHLKSHPYYLRSTVIIYAHEWKFLTRKMAEILAKYNLPSEKEIKWSYISSLEKSLDNKQKIKEDKGFYFLKDKKPEDIKAYISDVISILPELQYCKIIYTVTDNTSVESYAQKTILELHIKALMQRIEMELQSDKENLAVLFIDALNARDDKNLREAYSNIYKNGDFIQNYDHILDNLNLEYSHQSAGLQVADYLAGAFFSLITDRPLGKKLFKKYIFDCLRKNQSGEFMGFGVIHIPKSDELRGDLREKVLKVKPELSI